MKRAVGWLAAGYAVHFAGLLVFYLTWNAAFGVEGRRMAASWDIPLAYMDLIVTGVLAGFFTTRSVRECVSLWLVGPQWLSMFLCCIWLWSVLLFESVV